jgi:hypothetical protein
VAVVVVPKAVKVTREQVLSKIKDAKEADKHSRGTAAVTVADFALVDKERAFEAMRHPNLDIYVPTEVNGVTAKQLYDDIQTIVHSVVKFQRMDSAKATCVKAKELLTRIQDAFPEVNYRAVTGPTLAGPNPALQGMSLGEGMESMGGNKRYVDSDKAQTLAMQSLMKQPDTSGSTMTRGILVAFQCKSGLLHYNLNSDHISHQDAAACLSQLFGVPLNKVRLRETVVDENGMRKVQKNTALATASAVASGGASRAAAAAAGGGLAAGGLTGPAAAAGATGEMTMTTTAGEATTMVSGAAGDAGTPKEMLAGHGSAQRVGHLGGAARSRGRGYSSDEGSDEDDEGVESSQPDLELQNPEDDDEELAHAGIFGPSGRPELVEIDVEEAGSDALGDVPSASSAGVPSASSAGGFFSTISRCFC